METYGESIRFVRDHPPTHYIFEVNSFSMKQNKYESGVFEVGGYKWKMILYPNGKKEANVNDHISLYLAIQDTGSLPPTWEVNVDFRLFVYHQTQKNFLSIQYATDPLKRFHEAKREWGFPKLVEHEAFKDPTNGFLVNDRCIFGAEVFTGQPTKKSEDGQGHDFISKMDNPSALSGRDRRNCFPRSGSDLQNGLFRTFRDLEPAHFLFTTKSLSSVCKNDSGVYESDIFDYGGFKWRLSVYPKGNQKKNIKEGVSLYLRIVETHDMSKNWEVFVTFTFFIYDHIKDRFLTVQDGTVKRFHELKKEWGFENLISVNDFEDASNGFLVSDQCSFGTELIVIRHEGKIVEKLATKTVEKSPVVVVPVGKIVEKLAPKKVEKSPVVVVPVAKEVDPILLWKIENISKLAGKRIYSQPFSMGGFKWKVLVNPTGNGRGKDNSISAFLCLEEANKLSKSLELQTVFKIRLRDQLKSCHTEKKYTYGFSSKKTSWGTHRFIPLNNEFFKDIQDDIVVLEIAFISLSREEVAPMQ